MKVKLNKPVSSGDGELYMRGEHNVKESVAKNWIGKGYAVEVKEEKKTTKTKENKAASKTKKK